MTSIAQGRGPASARNGEQGETKTSSSHCIPRLRWVIGVLLGVGVLINYFDRINLSVAAPQLKHDFGLTDGELGWGAHEVATTVKEHSGREHAA